MRELFILKIGARELPQVSEAVTVRELNTVAGTRTATGVLVKASEFQDARQTAELSRALFID